MEKMSERMDKIMDTMVAENTNVNSKLDIITEKLEKIVETHHGDKNSSHGDEGELIAPLTTVKRSSMQSNDELNITLVNKALSTWITQTKQGDYY